MKPRRTRGLRFRLALATAAILLVSLAAVALLMSRVTRREFRRLEEERIVRGPLLPPPFDTSALESAFDAAHEWAGIEPVLSRLASAQGVNAVLVDVSGQVVALSRSMKAGSATRSGGVLRVSWSDESGGLREIRLLSPRGIALSSRLDGRPIGTLFVLPRLGVTRSAEEVAFVGSLDRWLIVAVGGAGLLALALLAAVSRRILGPVEELTRAAARLRAGRLGPRVSIRSEDEIGELGRAFNEMAEALETSEKLGRNLVSDVAHELRTPLTNIRCQLEAVTDGLSAADPSLIASLYEEALLLSGLVDDLQELAQAEAGTLRLRISSVCPRETCALALEAMRHGAEAAGVTVCNDVSDGLPQVHADPQRLAQVLRNLIANAIGHTSAGGTVRISGGVPDEQFIELAVRDTGEGIAPEHLPHVFERLYRADPSRSRESGGAGLGLAIVHRLVTLQGGGIRVESQLGHGATFSFTLPQAPRAPRAPEELQIPSSIRHTRS
ncbi:MAG: ATP-binding protein [Thermoanaerobaculia bacterium]